MRYNLSFARWWLPLCIAVFLGAATAQAEIKRENELVYGNAGERELHVNLARPAEGDGPFPAIVFVHGGGWRHGNRNAYSRHIEEAARRGYVAITVTYRLTEADQDGKAKFPFPAAVHDAKCAVRWLRANAEKYHVDPNRIGAAGGSAGGHLSLMLGLTDKSAGLEGSGGHADQSSRVQAVVNYFGPTEMVRMVETSPGAKPIIESFLDGTPDTAKDAFAKSSPLTYVSKDDPPVLSLHGDKDTLVPLEQAKLLDKKMKQVGASHTLKVIAGGGHGFPGKLGEEADAAMWAFFAEQLKPAKP